MTEPVSAREQRMDAGLDALERKVFGRRRELLPSEAVRKALKAARRRAALMREDLPSDPDEKAQADRLLSRDAGGATGWYDFWEPRDWRFVDAPEPVDHDRFRRGIRNGLLFSVPIWLLIIAAIAFLVRSW